jgi:hypothetical protein
MVVGGEMTDEGTKQSAQGGDRAAHLQMAQAVIGRMGQNSFYAKTWAVTLMAAVFAFAPSDGASKAGLWLLIIPAVVFWVLDAYYFRQEKLFRALHEGVVAGTVPVFSMTTGPLEAGIAPTRALMFAGSVWPVHVVTVLAIALKAAVAAGYLKVK